MNELVEFLRARLADDRLAVTDVHHANCEKIDHLATEKDPCTCGWPERLAADLASKLEIVELCENMEWQSDFGRDVVAAKTLRLLARSFTGHRDYRAEWAVE